MASLDKPGQESLRQALETTLDGKVDKPQLYSGLLGAIHNGRPEVVVNGRADYVWVRIRGATSEPVQAFNEKVASYYDLPVLLERDKELNRWVVVGRDAGQYSEWEGDPYLPKHGSAHSFAGADRTGGDVVWVYQRQFMPLLPRPLVTGGRAIWVEAGKYFSDGAYHNWPGSGTVDLEPYLPTGGINAKFVTVYIDTDTGTLDYIGGTEFDAYTPGAELESFISLPDGDAGIPVGAVYLTSGTEWVSWGEIWDLRLTPSPQENTGSFASVWADGTPLGTYSTIDFGDSLQVSLSGSYLRVDVTGAGGGGSTLDVYEDGVLEKSDATIINFTDNLNVEVSGTWVTVSAEGGGGDLSTGTIAVYDEGVFGIEARELDFGQYLDVSYSGSRATVVAAGASVIDFKQFSARVYNNADISVNDATGTALTFNTEEYDYGDFHSTVSNTSRMTAPFDGVFALTATVQFDTNATNHRQIWFLKNGTTIIAREIDTGLSGQPTALNLATLVQLDMGDYVEILAWQDSGGALDVKYVDQYSPVMTMSYAGGKTNGETTDDYSAKVYHNANQAISSSTDTVLDFNSEVFDNGDFHDTVTNNSRLTAPVTGKYAVTAAVEFTSNSSGARQIYIRKNGTERVAWDVSNAINGHPSRISVTTEIDLDATDYIEVVVYITAGGVSALYLDESSPIATIAYIGEQTLNGVTSTYSARAYHNANQSVGNSADTDLALNSEEYDNGDFHDTVTNNSRLTAPVDGVYTVTASAEFANNSTNNRRLELVKNGTQVIAQEITKGVTGTDTRQVIATEVYLDAGEYVELRVWQNSGGNLNVEYYNQTSPVLTASYAGNRAFTTTTDFMFTGTVAIYEDGQLEKADADRIDFTDNLNVEVSGSWVTVSAEGGGTTLELFENGGSLGLIEQIGFDDYLTAAISGSYGHVEADINAFDERFVNVGGDTMTGSLSVYGDITSLSASGTALLAMDNDGDMHFPEVGEPTNHADVGQIWAANDNTLYYKDGDGNVYVLGGAASRGFKSYNMTTQGLGFAPDVYVAGYYQAPATDANLDEGGATQTYGTAGTAYAAHAFIVVSGAGSVDTGQVGIRVTGISINDNGERNASDTEVLTDDITTLTANEYLESAKKWLGQVTFELYEVSGSPTTYSLDFNYGFCKYDDLGNINFTLTDFECVGYAGANDGNLNIELLHHRTSGWTYHATAFEPGAGAICEMDVDHATDDGIRNNENFAYKRANLTTFITGSGSEGFLVRVSSSAANSIEWLNVHIGYSQLEAETDTVFIQTEGGAIILTEGGAYLRTEE